MAIIRPSRSITLSTAVFEQNDPVLVGATHPGEIVIYCGSYRELWRSVIVCAVLVAFYTANISAQQRGFFSRERYAKPLGDRSILCVPQHPGVVCGQTKSVEATLHSEDRRYRLPPFLRSDYLLVVNQAGHAARSRGRLTGLHDRHPH